MSSNTYSSKLISEATRIKLRELAKQRQKLENHYATTIQKANESVNSKRKLNVLYHGISEVAENHPNLQNLDVLLEQARMDAFFGEDGIERWCQKFEKEIRSGQRRQLQSKLFGSVLDEWLKYTQVGKTSSMIDSDDDFVHINTSNDEMDASSLSKYKEQSLKLLETPHNKKDYDLSVIEAIMNQPPSWMKSNAPMNNALTDLRNSIYYHGRHSDGGMFSTVTKEEVRTAAQYVAMDLAVTNSQKRDALLEMISSDVSLGEIAGMISILIRDIFEWDWPRSESVSSSSSSTNMSDSPHQTENFPEKEANLPRLFTKRFPNGKYRSFLDGEVSTALFLHIVGTRWAIHMKQALRTFQRKVMEPPSIDQLRRAPRDSIVKIRETSADRFHMCILPDRSEEEPTEIYATYTPLDDQQNQESKAGLLRQQLLTWISSEIQLAKAIHPSKGLTVVALDIENYTPSICHDVVLEVCRTFGFSDQWISFFRKLMTPTVKEHDTGSVMTLKRGLPLRHMLSKMFSEFLMFLAQFEVQKMNEDPLSSDYVQFGRIMDDIYIWSENPVMAMKAYERFNLVLTSFGMKLNSKKCGSIHLKFQFGDPKSHPVLSLLKETEMNVDSPDCLSRLPQGPVRWSFLTLQTNGDWKVDEIYLNQFQESLVTKMKSKPSLLSQVNVYNAFMKQLMSMLGKPNVALGRPHLTSCLDAIQRIHGHLMGNNHSVIGYFQEQVKSRYNLHDRDMGGMLVPEAWFYWPVTAGGLGLIHPVVALFAVQQQFKHHYEFHENSYHHLPKYPPKNWDPELQRVLTKRELSQLSFSVLTEEGDRKWTPTEEYERQKSYFLSRLWMYENNTFSNLYHDMWMMDEMKEACPVHTPHFSELLKQFNKRGTKMRQRTQTNLGAYWQWIVLNYSEQVLDAFGSLEFAAAGVVPLSLILSIKKESSA